MELRILPSGIADMIAAGEVVQRPSSVVKELMENAVDAGASQVSVAISDSGRTMIRVVDDGCGMSPDDAVLCFQRHATSKIATAEDLQRILTFGFRGEALASIAAVSEVTLRTRREEDQTGCEVQFAAGEHLSTRETAAPKGSSFTVRNLFYNIPARRKFLKSDNVEMRHIIEEFTRVALTRPEVGFSLSHGGRDIFVLKPAKSLKFRILDLLGSSVVGDVVDISADTSIVSVRGYVGSPDSARKTLGNQFFFVNGRYFRSPYLHKAVMKAYENLIPEGSTPSYFIYMEADPGSVDVNIHPAKTEVKFEDDSIIFQTLLACIKASLGKNAAAGSIDFDNPEERDMPVIGSRFEEYRPASIPQAGTDPSYDPFAAPAAGPAKEFDYSRYVDKSGDYGRLFEDRPLPSAAPMVVQGRFIIARSTSGLMVIHARRAMERILYDRFIRALSKSAHVTQTSLFPVQINVGAEGRTVFDANARVLSSLGFDIVPFGTDTIVVNGVPEGCSTESGKVEKLMADILIALSDGTSPLPGMMESALAGKLAAAAAAGISLDSPSAAQGTVDALLSSDNPEFTGSGKRIISIIGADELEKRF